MLPVHYSFYRYSLVGEGGFYALVHGFLACFFAAVYVLLFFAWVQRLTDAMFQLPILAVLGVVGASVVGLYLLVDLFYGTPVYGLAAIVCLAVSGVCWQACPLAAVRADERLRALPDAATVRVWVPLLAAYVLVTLLHALVFSAEGSVFERASAHARLIDTGMVVVGVLFCGLAAAGRLRGVPPHRALTLVIALITMFYVGVCCLVGTPGAMEVGGSYAVLSMMMRTLRVFVFFVLVSMCYRAAAAPASTLGLLFLAVELLADLACYVAAPALFGWLGFDAAAAVGGVLQVSALVLAAVSLVFLAGSLWDMARLAQAASPVSWGRLGGQPASTDDRRRQVCRVLGEEAGLTERETDIMYFLSLGFSVKKIADLLTISANTVATHSSRLYRKLGVHARQEVIDAVDARLGA